MVSMHFDERIHKYADVGKAVHAVYDNGGITKNRYTILLKTGNVIFASDEPDTSYGSEVKKIHVDALKDALGEKINFYILPEQVLRHLRRKLQAMDERKAVKQMKSDIMAPGNVSQDDEDVPRIIRKMVAKKDMEDIYDVGEGINR
ncbi:MAG: hypothetical protein DDT19_01800 [Syntrophomonadaceae bacterium]|nr:hypothetical protein [Bacillota bacterium]